MKLDVFPKDMLYTSMLTLLAWALPSLLYKALLS